MRRTPNSIRTISATPWKARATLRKKPKPRRKTWLRRRSGERNEPCEANGPCAAIELDDGSGTADQTHRGQGIYPKEETPVAGPRGFSSPRRCSSFSAGFHTARL